MKDGITEPDSLASSLKHGVGLFFGDDFCDSAAFGDMDDDDWVRGIGSVGR